MVSFIFLLDFGTVTTVWYLIFFILLSIFFLISRSIDEDKSKNERGGFDGRLMTKNATKLSPYFLSNTP